MVLGAIRKLRKSLGRTREQVLGRIGAALRREVYLDDDFIEEVEEILIGADVGVEAAVQLSEGLGRLLRKEGGKASLEDVTRVLREELEQLLRAAEGVVPELGGPPHVILMVGVNGVGKTTTIAKLARMHRDLGRRVLLAAGDTFRAAAVEQLTRWAEHLQVELVTQSMGADPAAVAYDAMRRAMSEGYDVLIIDTAGRLQNKDALMQELEKIGRVVAKQMEGAPHETLLCLDATTGQNGIGQAREFSSVVKLDAICLTKLDGSAKGGVVVAIAQGLGLPVRYVGTGEGAEDLERFDAAAFAEALFSVPDAERDADAAG